VLLSFVSTYEAYATAITTDCPSGVVLRRGGGACPQIHLLPPDSKASWKNVGLYGVRIFSVSENG